MTGPRIAFTAAYWGDRAVVCRAVENCAGPVVDQQFGEFTSWSAASLFASRLNEGLDIGWEDSQQIVNSATSGVCDVVNASQNVDKVWNRAPALVVAEWLRWKQMQARLDLGLTFCDLLEGEPGHPLKQQLLRQVRVALAAAQEMVLSSNRSGPELRIAAMKMLSLERRCQECR